jgi:hypothetical protein
MRLRNSLVAVAGAALVLGIAASVASAGRLEMSSNNFRLTFARVKIESDFNPNVNCPVTMEGSLHSRTISKVAGSLVGYITSARLGTCEESMQRATILQESLPWHVRYRSFSGRLPEISKTSFDIIGFNIRTQSLSNPCLLRTTVSEPLLLHLFREAGGAISEAELEARRLPTPCIAFVEIIARSGTVTVLSGSTRVTVRLI